MKLFSSQTELEGKRDGGGRKPYLDSVFMEADVSLSLTSYSRWGAVSLNMNNETFFGGHLDVGGTSSFRDNDHVKPGTEKETEERS